MKVRIKFSKTGALRYIGHLDVMRYFQKAIRRTDIAASYSNGFSPHMIMSFAEPLGVGLTSIGEYFDLELDYNENTCPGGQYLLDALNAQMADAYFRDMWLSAFSFATLIVTDDCPYTDAEIFAIGSEISLSICKAYKEIPGLPEGNYDRDKIFKELVKK